VTEEREKTQRPSWVCEFRSGSYLQAASLGSGPLATARQFANRLEVYRVIREYEWIAANGGMAARVVTCHQCKLVQVVPKRSSKLVSKMLWWCDQCFEPLEARVGSPKLLGDAQ
jgi:hypothetical protein